MASIYVDPGEPSPCTNYDPTAPSGSRCGGGSDTMLTTLQAALAIMGAGDAVYMRGGIYGNAQLGGGTYNTLRIPESVDGTAGGYSSLQSFPGEWAVLDGENNVQPDASQARGILYGKFRAPSFFIFQNFELKRGRVAAGAPADQDSYGGIASVGGEHIVFRNLYFHDFRSGTYGQNPSALWFNTTDKVNNITVEHCVFRDIGYIDGNTDAGNFSALQIYGPYGDPLTNTIFNGWDGATGPFKNKIRNNLFEDINGKGIKYKSTAPLSGRYPFSDTYAEWGDHFHNNIFRNCDSFAMEIRADFAQVHNNITDATAGFSLGSISGAMYKPAVYNNTFNGQGYAPVEYPSVQWTMFDEGTWVNAEHPTLPHDMHGLLSNNIVADGKEVYYSKVFGLGPGFGGNHDVDFDPDMTDFHFDHNYVYNPPSAEIVSSRINSVRTHYSQEQIEARLGCQIFQKTHDAGDTLFVGTTGADKYKIRATHLIESGVTAGAGGIGGNHPFLSGVSLPSYLGAVDPDDNGWVDEVLAASWIGVGGDPFDPPVDPPVDPPTPGSGSVYRMSGFYEAH